MFETPVYRGIVVYSNSTTGEITVRVPVLTGTDSTIPISFVGRTAYNGVWPVPAIGSQIVVTADDAHLTNVFWVQVNPDAPTSLTGVTASITALQTAVGDNESNINAVRTVVAANAGATDRNTTDISTINSTISTVSTDVYRTTNMLQTMQAVNSSLEARVSELDDYKDAFYLGIYR
jgi:hypothetical protein